MRDNVVIFEGKIQSLRRFKTTGEVKPLRVRNCLERFNDPKVGDIIEVFTVERIAVSVQRGAPDCWRWRVSRVRARESRTRSRSMVVGLLSVELQLPGARALKDKRMVLRGVKDRIRKLNVAVAEIGITTWAARALGGSPSPMTNGTLTELPRSSPKSSGWNLGDHTDPGRVPDITLGGP